MFIICEAGRDALHSFISEYSSRNSSSLNARNAISIRARLSKFSVVALLRSRAMKTEKPHRPWRW